MNVDKKLKRIKKRDKKNKKSTDKINKSLGIKQLIAKPLPILKELPKESIQSEGQEGSSKKSEGQEGSLKNPEDTENSEDEEADKQTDPSEIQMLDSLTGIPYTEDELLFAVPVVAPYSALTNYK